MARQALSPFQGSIWILQSSPSQTLLFWPFLSSQKHCSCGAKKNVDNERADDDLVDDDGVVGVLDMRSGTAGASVWLALHKAQPNPHPCLIKKPRR